MHKRIYTNGPNDVCWPLANWTLALSSALNAQNWDKLRTVVLDTLEAPLDSERVAPLISGLALEVKPALERFILAAFAVFHDLDCTLLEMNPWCDGRFLGKRS